LDRKTLQDGDVSEVERYGADFDEDFVFVDDWDGFLEYFQGALRAFLLDTEYCVRGHFDLFLESDRKKEILGWSVNEQKSST
jgi:hypothetical protein